MAASASCSSTSSSPLLSPPLHRALLAPSNMTQPLQQSAEEMNFTQRPSLESHIEHLEQVKRASQSASTMGTTDSQEYFARRLLSEEPNSTTETLDDVKIGKHRHFHSVAHRFSAGDLSQDATILCLALVAYEHFTFLWICSDFKHKRNHPTVVSVARVFSRPKEWRSCHTWQLTTPSTRHDEPKQREYIHGSAIRESSNEGFRSGGLCRAR